MPCFSRGKCAGRIWWLNLLKCREWSILLKFQETLTGQTHRVRLLAYLFVKNVIEG